MRHAKSSRDDPALADHERPLSPRGRRAARRVGRHLAREGVAPALVLCSSAARARETLERLGDAPAGARIEVEAALYGASGQELLERLRLVPGGVDSVLVVGHNPGLQELAVALTGDPRVAARFPTGALATIELPAWARLAAGAGRLAALVVPRELE